MADKVKIKGIKVNGAACLVEYTPVGVVVSPNGTEYELRVDDEGNLYAFDPNTVPGALTPPTTSGQTLAKLYINSFYCGGKNADEHTLNYCSHNFVELSNLTENDINLKGLSLQYAINGTDWEVLPLSGVIRAGSTFVVRGAQCSKMESPTTKIVVDKYDQEWYDSHDNLIAFDSNLSAKFYLAFNLTKYAGENPYDATTYVKSDAIGYVDLIGVSTGSGDPGGYENKPYSAGGGLSNTKLFRKYYAMDPVSQATKEMAKRNNANDWCYIDLTKNDGELIPSIEVYRPMASFEKKNLFYNKTKLSSKKPSAITCSFGRRATDKEDGNGATRCFNWITGNLNSKYIWIRQSGTTNWGIAHESFYNGDGREDFTASTYNRIMKEYTDNTVLIANKYILSGLTAGTYEYIAGSKNNDGTPNIDECTPIYKFIVRTDTEVNTGFKFVQTSDQQGFNWEEYRVWEYASKTIGSEYGNEIQFMMNTGDMTQNGNRMGEWLDYLDAKTEYFNNMEEVATIGNNDLSLNVLYKIGNGADNSKLWHENITFFYTFELDPDNMPVFRGYDGNDYEIPSLYSFDYGKVHFMSVNTEIKKATETSEYGYGFGGENWGIFYPQIKEWCERDIAPYSADTSIWKIVFCHEMPFTILIPSVAQAVKMPVARTGGSNSNDNNPESNVFWLSEFCQTHGIKLCLGGHKHTEASTWQIPENVKYDGDVRTVDSMHPIIVVNNNPSSDFYIGKYCTIGDAGRADTGSTELIPYEFTYTLADDTTITFEGKYPDKWFNFDEETSAYTLNNRYSTMVKLCTFEWEENLPSGTTPVLYAMSQATSYKHTSNKELPSKNIPWLRYYFNAESDSPSDGGTVNAEQKYPFFTVWEIGNNSIKGAVRKVYGIFDGKGKFDINIDYPRVKNGKAAAALNGNISIRSINGITSMSAADADTDERIITINR